MTEYITKEQAIHAMEQVTQPECFIEDTRKGFARIIEELPAADVVEVVRCENCKHMRTISGEGWGIDTKLYYCGENEILVSPVGYCSDGKRRNGSESDD